MAGGQSLVGREMCPSWLSSPAATSPDTTRMGTMGGGADPGPFLWTSLCWPGRAAHPGVLRPEAPDASACPGPGQPRRERPHSPEGLRGREWDGRRAWG